MVQLQDVFEDIRLLFFGAPDGLGAIDSRLFPFLNLLQGTDQEVSDNQNTPAIEPIAFAYIHSGLDSNKAC